MNALPAPPPVAAGASEARALAFLADLSQTLAVSLDLRQTLDEAINRIAAFMGAEAASLFLLDASGREVPGSRLIGAISATDLATRLAI